MKKQIFCAAAVAGAVLLGACNKPAEDAQKAAAPAADAIVATVNGKPISKALFSAVLAEMTQRSGGQAVPGDKLLDDLISLELLRQEAEKQNLAKDPVVAAKIENTTRSLLAQAAAENFRKTTTISDEEVKKEYDTKVVANKANEFKAAHILLDSEEAAKDVIAKLQKGAKFGDLAKKLSKDPSAKQNGGELGWFNPQQMVPEFGAALAGMKNGETSSAPVKSQFGWHVIQRQDSRELPPPPFDAIKEQMRSGMIMEKLQKYVEGLKTAAKIERKELPKAEAPAAAAPAAAPAADKAAEKPAEKAAEKPAEKPAEKAVK